MAWPVVAGVVTTALGLGAGGAAVARRRRRAAMAALHTAALPHDATPAQPATPGLDLGGLLGAGKGLLSGAPAGVVAAGLKVNDLAGQLVEVAGGGVGKADAVRVVGVAGLLPTLASVGADKLLGAVGIDDPKAKQTAGQVAAAATVGLAVPVLGLKAADALLGVIAPGVQDVVHKGLGELDPTNPKSAVGGVVSVVAGGVKDGIGGVVDAVGGLFTNEPPPPPPDPVKVRALAQIAGYQRLKVTELAVIAKRVADGEPWNEGDVQLSAVRDYSDSNWDRGTTRGSPGVMLDVPPTAVGTGDAVLFLSANEQRAVTLAWGSALGGSEVFLAGGPLSPQAHGAPGNVLVIRGGGAQVPPAPVVVPVLQEAVGGFTSPEDAARLAAGQAKAAEIAAGQAPKKKWPGPGRYPPTAALAAVFDPAY